MEQEKECAIAESFSQSYHFKRVSALKEYILD